VKISRNVWCLLVLLKSIFIFCVDPSVRHADESLFENKPCILKSCLFWYMFATFPLKFFIYFLTFCFFAKQIEAKFREKCEIFLIFRERTKCKNYANWSRNDFFLFDGNPITCWVYLLCNRVTHKGWDFRDDNVEFILSISLDSWLFATVLVYFKNKKINKTKKKIFRTED